MNQSPELPLQLMQYLALQPQPPIHMSRGSMHPLDTAVFTSAYLRYSCMQVVAVGALDSNNKLHDAEKSFTRGPSVVRARNHARSIRESLVHIVHRRERESVACLEAIRKQGDYSMPIVIVEFKAQADHLLAREDALRGDALSGLPHPLLLISVRIQSPCLDAVARCERLRGWGRVSRCMDWSAWDQSTRCRF